MSTNIKPFRIESIRWNNGTTFAPTQLTVLVGPNNSGKSQALRDILKQTTDRPSKSVVVSEVTSSYPDSFEQLQELYHLPYHQHRDGNWYLTTLGPQFENTHHVNINDPNRLFSETASNRHKQIGAIFGKALVAHLSTESRLQLVRKCNSVAPNETPSLPLQALFRSGSQLTLDISRTVHASFGRQLALDFTQLTQLELRVADDFSEMPPDPRDAYPKMQQKERLDEQGDGIRSFIGLIVALEVLDRPLVLIDEPEAFLHPPQAYRMGSIIADNSSKGRQLVVATHSVDVLRGILSKVQDVNVVRIDRPQSNNTFCILDPARLAEIANDPLLTSARVVEGLFYPTAIVVEAESDARFYNPALKKIAGAFDTYFVNADNKQTVARIVKLYHGMGVRAAGIVDFDFLNDATEMKAAMTTLEMSPAEIELGLETQRVMSGVANTTPASGRLAQLRKDVDDIGSKLAAASSKEYSSAEERAKDEAALLRSLEGRMRSMSEATKAWKGLKESGVTLLPAEAKDKFAEFQVICAKYGLFINPAGELESLLKDYGIGSSTDKKRWIVQALQLVPALEPDMSKQPWKFLDTVKSYLESQ